MNWQSVLKSIDDLVFQQTGKHLDNLQMAILKGVLNGEKYADIAEQYKCTMGHVKDEGYELWQILSQILGEDLNKSNFCATIERLGFVNSQHQIIGNPVQIGNLNLCTNPDNFEVNNKDTVNPDSPRSNPTNQESKNKNILNSTLIKTISKFNELGLTPEEISETMNLPLGEVLDSLK
ncbi:hypothetical protein [Laspinema olomoucense]|uniref:vWA-MoxR associated protein N-terminal HTH domain-containing protein n=1 Tax=Laspinema olomoucense D3b TaxID=2953688 RepID=A0ABT2NCE5_9CYAN|nr:MULTISPECIES: hypothetical protein [unclassified Laspinema]MCT7973964.1 hypothetical protein [Laspinema sp. D3d]MCT7980352.1 hypothetical protein [Laspinema sp. D3b]MCT7991940.1 hypothetical protein [Laspinema sp. D3a]